MPPPKEMMHQPFDEWLKMVLREDDSIEVPTDLGILINEIHKSGNLCHVEFPSKDNDLESTILWTKKAWVNSIERREKARKVSTQNKLEFENYKDNIRAIAAVLASKLIRDPEDLMETAQMILRKNPEGCAALGVEIRKPYYRGVYVVIPFREPKEYRS